MSVSEYRTIMTAEHGINTENSPLILRLGPLAFESRQSRRRKILASVERFSKSTGTSQVTRAHDLVADLYKEFTCE